MPVIRGAVKLCAVMLVILLILLARPAAAFGPDGHLIVGYIADEHLCTGTRRELKPLMGRYSLGETGAWADLIRSDPQWQKAKPWHYLNVGDQQSIANRKRSPDGDVLQAIAMFEPQIDDRSLDPQARIEALRFVVHFVADVHQPLHIGRTQDRGGNLIEVRAGGDATNLHVLWDSYLIRETGLEPLDYAQTIAPLADGNVEAWQASTPLDWAAESQALRPRVYGYGRPGDHGTVNLSDAYLAESRALVELRLVQAGVRLAGVLNDMYCNTPGPEDAESP